MDEKGRVPSRAEDFLATDLERERCREVLRRSVLGVWDGLKMVTAVAGGVKRMRKEDVGHRRVQRRRVDNGEQERSLEWE